MQRNLHRERRFAGSVVALIVAILWLVGGTLRQPVSAQSGITTPASGSSVSGDVVVIGTAMIDPFQKYELHFKLEPSGDDAYVYFTGNTVPVQNGPLGVWQTGGLPAGNYSLRLRVVKNDGNYAEFFAQNISVNQGPPQAAASPTSSEPTPTAIPTATYTPAPQPSPVVGQVDQPALDLPTPTPTAEAVAVIDPGQSTGGDASLTTTGDTTVAGDSGGSVTRELGEALSLNRLRGQFFNGIRFSAALFLGVAALYTGKRLFDWVWTQFR